MAELRAVPAPDAAMLSVALRELRRAGLSAALAAFLLRVRPDPARADSCLAMRHNRAKKTNNSGQGGEMAYELLRRIIAGALPMTVTHEEDIEHLRILRDAGYVKADIPTEDGLAPTVTAVTPLGRTAMRYFGGG